MGAPRSFAGAVLAGWDRDGREGRKERGREGGTGEIECRQRREGVGEGGKERGCEGGREGGGSGGGREGERV